MSIELHTIDNGTVQAINDGRLYASLTGKTGAIVEGAAVTTTSGLIVHIASGWGIACGRVFTITEEDFTVIPASSGTQKGRVYVHIDLTSDTPISIMSYAGASLPALRQDDLSTDGFIYEIELANYDVDAVNISNLVSNTAQPIIANAKTLNGKTESQLSVANANNLGGLPASAYMPKSGGTFSGRVVSQQINSFKYIDFHSDGEIRTLRIYGGAGYSGLSFLMLTRYGIYAFSLETDVAGAFIIADRQVVSGATDQNTMTSTSAYVDINIGAWQAGTIVYYENHDNAFSFQVL